MSIDTQSILACSAIATARGVGLTLCTHPLDVVKILLQDGGRSVPQVVSSIYAEKGSRGFYQGLLPKLNRVVLKEFWRWPAIVYLPAHLEDRYSLRPLTSQVATGFFISTVDSVFSAPFERHQIRTITGTLPPKEKELSGKIRRVLRGGWVGLAPLWFRASVGWVSFSISQRWMRDKYKEVTAKTELDLQDLAVIGIGVGIFVSLSIAPFDFANTKAQSRSLSMRSIFSSKIGLKQLFKGASIQAIILSIHNITSVILIEKLSRQSD